MQARRGEGGQGCGIWTPHVLKTRTFSGYYTNKKKTKSFSRLKFTRDDPGKETECSPTKL